MAQVKITDLRIKQIADQSSFQEVFEQAAFTKAWEMLATTLADANITNRRLEKIRDYCKRITASGVQQARSKLFVWTVLNKMREAGTTIDDTDILERQPDGTTPGFDKLKAGAEAAFEVFAGIQQGDETAPVVNTDAPALITGTVAPTGTPDFVSQMYYDETGNTLYIGKAAGWTKIA